MVAETIDPTPAMNNKASIGATSDFMIYQL